MASSLSTITLTEPAQIASYNRGPITSLLALPRSCTQTLTSVQQNLYFGHYFEPYDQSCIVLGTLEPLQIAPLTMWGQYYYSPAICPKGWTIAATFSSSFLFTSHGAVRTAYNLPLGPDTSAALCCPSGYTSLSDDHVCASTVSMDQAISFMKPTIAGQIYKAGTVVVTKVAESTIVKGDGIPIWWQSTDTQKLSSAAAATPTPTRSDSFTPDTTAGHAISGLSVGAKIGIGVGVPSVVIAGVLVGLYIWTRRPNRANGGINLQTTGCDASKPNTLILSRELDDHGRYEMGEAAPELAAGRGPAYELGEDRRD